MNDDIISFEALGHSVDKCKKGVTWKPSVAHFVLNEPEEVLKMADALQNGTYKQKQPRKLIITSPKRREAVCIAFCDRVYQRSLNDNRLYPAMTRSFIYDNWTCQKGKGTDNCRDRLKDMLREYYRHHGTDGYVYQFDIRKYYPTMSHEVAEACFRRKLDDDTYNRCVEIMRTQYDGDTGYNPGSQMIQIAGISVLDSMDHFVKETLQERYYMRYMDDFFIISPDKERLVYCREQIETKLKDLCFELHPAKTRLYRLLDGIPFLGFTFRLTETGKVLMLLNADNVKRERKKLRRLVNKSKRGEIAKDRVDASYAGWRVHAEKGNTHNLLRRMDKYYKRLWEGKE